jgi:hypothetical protein
MTWLELTISKLPDTDVATELVPMQHYDYFLAPRRFYLHNVSNVGIW